MQLHTTMSTSIKSLCVFCGSSDKVEQKYLDTALNLGSLLAQEKIRLVYGAGSTGLMGAVAEGTLQSGGEVTGVIPKLFDTPVLAHRGLTHIEVVDTIHQRQARMVELSDAFIALPGGYGTLGELFEALTWSQIGLHQKPIGLLNVDGYYNGLLSMLEHASQEGFIYSDHLGLFSCAQDPKALLEALRCHNHPDNLEAWLTRSSKNNMQVD